MRAVYLIIWAIVTALVCYLLYNQDDKAKLTEAHDVLSPADEIELIDSTYDRPFSERSSEVGQEDSVVANMITPSSSEANETEDSILKTKTETVSSKGDQKLGEEESADTPEQVDYLQKAFIEFGQNSMKLPKMESLEKFMDSIALVVVPSDLKIVLEGHADKSKSKRHDNFEVGQKRADFLKDALLSRGVPEERIETISRGDTVPRMIGNSDEARKRNRRVELFIKKNNR